MRTTSMMVLTLLAAAACSDVRSPTATSATVAADRSAAACSKRPDVTVSDEAGLAAALGSVRQGEVIGIAGLITITSDVNVATAGVTLTCATPGSGLVAAPGVINLVNAMAPDVAVDGLILDGSAGAQPFWSSYDGVTSFPKDVRLTNSRVTCSPDNSCAVILGGTGAVISDNYFEADGAFDGIHVQVGGASNEFSADGARIERNTVVALTPSTGHRQGGIRIFLAKDVLIANNTIQGPWSNGISPARLTNSTVAGNRIDGALNYGIALSWVAGTQGLPGDFNDVFRQNQISGSGVAGIRAYLGCYNQFIANDLRGNAGGLGMVFPDSSGGNTVVGDTRGFQIVDNGAYDCDGDGVIDPNVIRGPRNAASVSPAIAIVPSTAQQDPTKIVHANNKIRGAILY